MSDPNLKRRTFKLPDGREADVIEPAKGKHLRKASRLTSAAGQSASQFDAVSAMIAVKCRIEGEPITVEEIDELDEEIVNALASEATGTSDAAKKASAARLGKAETTPSESTSSSPNGT